MDLRPLYKACLIEAWVRLIVTLLIGIAIGLVIMCFIGCDTPYTGFLGAGDIDGYLESAGADRVSALRMDSILFASRRYRDSPAVMAKMAEMAKTVNLSSVREGRAVPRVNPEGTASVVYLELEKIVTEIETVEVPVIEKEIFVLHVSRTEMTYHTPIGEVFVPENAPVVAPSDVRITPVQSLSDARSE